MNKRILFICGSINQTRQMHQIAQNLGEYEHAFTPYYGDGMLALMRSFGLLELSVLGHKMTRRCLEYLHTFDLPVDYMGEQRNYDLVLTCSDLVIPQNIRGRKTILVQEGMTDPETVFYHLVKMFPVLPRWIASTATTGLSGMYDRFCVASEGYKQLFIQKGAPAEKLVVTGIPNFDNCVQYLENDFPHKHFVLVCTSDSRETYKFEDRKQIILDAVTIANGRKLIFKLHPNENLKRAVAEINRYAPNALVSTGGNTEHMIANCDVLITRFSTTVYVGLALGKECYSDFDIEVLKQQLPIQNGGTSAAAIADVCRGVLAEPRQSQTPVVRRRKTHTHRSYSTALSQLFARFPA